MAQQVNSREFQEKGSVGSNIIRRVEVWGVDPSYVGAAKGTGIPLTLCRDSTGFIYQVLAGSAVGTSSPQPGEIWLINRTLGFWTFMSRIQIPSPLVQTVTANQVPYSMQPCNRFVFGAPPSGTSWVVTLPNPIIAVQGEIYGFRNTSGGGVDYNGLLSLAAFGNETIHGPNGFGAHSGASFVTDNKEWFCVGDTTASGGTSIGGS